MSVSAHSAMKSSTWGSLQYLLLAWSMLSGIQHASSVVYAANCSLISSISVAAMVVSTADDTTQRL